MFDKLCRVLATTVLWLLEHPRYSWREAWRKFEWYQTTIKTQFPRNK